MDYIVRMLFLGSCSSSMSALKSLACGEIITNNICYCLSFAYKSYISSNSLRSGHKSNFITSWELSTGLRMSNAPAKIPPIWIKTWDKNSQLILLSYVICFISYFMTLMMLPLFISICRLIFFSRHARGFKVSYKSWVEIKLIVRRW